MKRQRKKEIILIASQDGDYSDERKRKRPRLRRGCTEYRLLCSSALSRDLVVHGLGQVYPPRLRLRGCFLPVHSTYQFFIFYFLLYIKQHKNHVRLDRSQLASPKYSNLRSSRVHRLTIERISLTFQAAWRSICPSQTCMRSTPCKAQKVSDCRSS